MSDSTASPQLQLEQMESLNQEIEFSLQNGELEASFSKIQSYGSYFKDARYYNLLANYYFQKGELETALSALTEGLQIHAFNYEMNYNAAVVCEQLGEASKCLNYYGRSAKYARNETEQKHCVGQIDRVVKILQNGSPESLFLLKEEIEQLESFLNSADHRSYPLDVNGHSLVRRVMEKDTPDEYMVNMYKSYNVTDVNESLRMFFKTEQFKGKEYNEQAIFKLDASSIIPLSLIHPSTKVDIFVNDKIHPFSQKPLRYNQYHYIRINEPGTLRIVMDQPIFVGHPIPVADEPKKSKLILKIFIDGLSGKFLEQEGLEHLMPNTYGYFKNGFIADRCYANSEWTLPSKASINTGKYSTHHRLLHPNWTYAFEKKHTLMAEYLKQNGYFTTKIDENWRTTPNLGYHKGFDRILFQNLMGGMDCRNIIMEAIEHLEAFNQKNNFLSISFTDLHHVPDEIEDHLLAQVNTDISARVDANKRGLTSVLSKYDENKIAKYRLEIQRIDTFLGVLFKYLTDKFDDEEICVVLHSDHGQTFLEVEDSILHDSRRKIPLMIKGRAITADIPRTEFIESVDILPILLKINGIEPPTAIDGKLPACFGGEAERKQVLTQVLHPGQTYKAAVTDRIHTLSFESSTPVNGDLSVNLKDYRTLLLHRETGKDEKALYPEKASEYEQLVFNQVKSFMDWPNPVND